MAFLDNNMLGGGNSSLSDIATNQKALNQNISQLIQVLQNIFRNTGSFTWNTASATFVVTNTGVQATTQVLLIPTNAAAATLLGSNEYPYVSSRVVGTSFTLSTAAGTAAAGTETFFYVLITPI